MPDRHYLIPQHPLNRPVNNEIPTDLVTLDHACKIARISIQTLRRWIKRGRVPLYGYSKAERVSLSSVVPRVTSRRAKLYYTAGDVPNAYTKHGVKLAQRSKSSRVNEISDTA